jgi:DNA-binding MarR family transcriptional regulator
MILIDFGVPEAGFHQGTYRDVDQGLCGSSSMSARLDTLVMPLPTPEPRDGRTPQTRLAEGALSQIVGYQLAQATVATTQVFQAQAGRPLRLRPVEFTVLSLVRKNPDASARQLARALAMTPPNIALWLERLEARGLVVRERSRSDARVQHIRTTAKGTALADTAAQRLIDGEQAALAALSSAERAMLVELLHKLALCRK